MATFALELRTLDNIYHRSVRREDLAGLQHVNIIKTGDRTYCIIAEWTDKDALAAVGRCYSVRRRPA